MSSIGKNSSFLRELNTKAIINIIRNNSISRSDISKITQLTKPAVSSIIDFLIKEGYVLESTSQEANVGRRPKILKLRPDSFYSFGVNIYRDNCLVSLADFSGQVIYSSPIDIINLPPVIAVKVISNKIIEIKEKYKIENDSILGVGISIPGPVNALNGQILNPPNFEAWHNFDLANQFKKELELPVFVENDATAYALLENLFGYGNKFKNYFMFVMVDGVGSAAIIDGLPLRGINGSVTEIGHVSIDINGDLCNCGNKGCLELYTSIPKIIEKAKKMDDSIQGWENIVDYALNANTQCLQLLDELAHYLSFAIANVVNIFAPEAIIFSGVIQYKSDLLISLIRTKYFTEYCQKRFYEPNILMSKIAQSDNLNTANAIVLNNFFYSDKSS